MKPLNSKYYFMAADEKLRKWLKEYVKAVKEWAEEKSWEAEQLSRLVESWEEKLN